MFDFDAGRFVVWFRAIRQVRREFRVHHKCPPRLLRPRKFTEKMQWRKLFDLNPLFAVLSDKLAVRDYIAARVGPDVLVPMLWSGDDPQAIPFDTLEPPYVIKGTHAAGQGIYVERREDIHVEGYRAAIAGWLAHCHGTALCEPGYVPVPHRIIVERFLAAPDGTRPHEYSLFVFDGRVRFVQMRVLENNTLRLGAFFDRDWRKLDWYFHTRPVAGEIPRPARFDEMVAISERLGVGIDHVRVDLYDCHDRVRVGELTLYSWSGHHPTNPRSADYALGAAWRIERPALRALWTVATRRYAITV